MSDEHPTWPTSIDGVPCLHMRRPITEDWLRSNGFRIDDGRNDPRMPIRSLAIGSDLVGGRPFLGSSDDLCIDVAPTDIKKQDEWFVWIGQREPYRHIHVRYMRTTDELVRLYEGLTGRVWPGTL
jgi:hypothetical protein